jgi:hypothetical protein
MRVSVLVSHLAACPRNVDHPHLMVAVTFISAQVLAGIGCFGLFLQVQHLSSMWHVTTLSISATCLRPPHELVG